MHETGGTDMRLSRSTAARSCASSPGRTTVQTSMPPSATRNLPRTPRSGRSAGIRVALRRCPTAVRQADDRTRSQPDPASAKTASMVQATNDYLNRAIRLAIAHLRVGSVMRADIARFCHEFGRRKPGDANRSHDLLRNMFDCLTAWDQRLEAAGKPCIGIVGDRFASRGRLLGHRRASTMNRYVDLDDATLGQYGERVACALFQESGLR